MHLQIKLETIKNSEYISQYNIFGQQNLFHLGSQQKEAEL